MGVFLPSVPPTRVCSPPNESSGSQTPSVSDRTCQVLAQEQQGHKSVLRPLWLPREHWGTARKRDAADREGSGHCPSPLGDSPAGTSQSLVWNQCPVPCRGQSWPLAKRPGTAPRSPYPMVKEAEGISQQNDCDRNQSSWNPVPHLSPSLLPKQSHTADPPFRSL